MPHDESMDDTRMAQMDRQTKRQLIFVKYLENTLVTPIRLENLEWGNLNGVGTGNKRRILQKGPTS